MHKFTLHFEHELQEAQLSQRNCALLRVIEYFAKSLEVIWKDTVEYGVCKYLLVLHWNYVCISYNLWDIQRQRMAWPWKSGRSRSL